MMVKAEQSRRPILRARGVSKRFSGVLAVDDVDLDVHVGEIVAIVGANGAGKSTLFNVMAGDLKATSGSVFLDGEDISHLPAHRICQKGLARTFQTARPLLGMTTLQNVAVGALAHTSDIARAMEAAEQYVDMLDLSGEALSDAGSLTLAAMKRLEVARALATRPRVLLMDEMMAGLNPEELEHFMERIKDIGAIGVTLVFVEHVMRAVAALASRVVVLDRGAKIAEGNVEQIMKDEKVIEAYLGQEYVA